VSREPRYYPGAWGSQVDVPIRIGGQVLAVLSAENRETHAFNQDDFEVLTAAAHQAGLAIEKARLLAAERQRADELDALRTTMADITAELELPALLQAIVERAAGLLDATGGELGLPAPAQPVRTAGRHRHRERPLVRPGATRNCRTQAGGGRIAACHRGRRNGQSGQERVSGQHEPRAPHPSQRHPGFHPTDGP